MGINTFLLQYHTGNVNVPPPLRHQHNIDYIEIQTVLHIVEMFWLITF